MTDTQAAQPEVTPTEMIEIFRGREWARLVVGQIDTLKLHSFYACHALLGEVFAKLLNIDIEAARAVELHEGSYRKRKTDSCGQSSQCRS